VRLKTLFGGLLGVAIVAFGQRIDGVFFLLPDHPAIRYSTQPTSDAVSQLNRNIQEGKVRLEYEGSQGYLRSVLDALKVPIESQMMVFSKTSVQREIIRPGNPRTLFFNDAVTVGYVHGGFIELAAEDPRQGVSFYTLDQSATDKPVFKRRHDCLGCHVSYATLGVPGMLVRSVATAASGLTQPQFGQYVSDHRSPLQERWGGWYVTGKNITVRHMGNTFVINPGRPESALTSPAVTPESLLGKLDTDAYLSPYSDIVALMVFEHQMHMTNLLTRIDWEARYAEYRDQAEASGSGETRGDFQAATVPALGDTASELVDYLLFVDEAPLPGKIEGTSGFTEKFSALGPHDSKGRSLRQFDLKHRLMRYPCSYMIYSPAFDALPDQAKSAIYKRMWEIISGKERAGKYARLSSAERRAVVEILRETKKELPSYFQPISR
jgi:hypothetical protein